MLNRLNQLAHDEEGQGLTEYVIITALVAVAAFAIVRVFGDTLQTYFAKMLDILTDTSEAQDFEGGYGNLPAQDWDQQ